MCEKKKRISIKVKEKSRVVDNTSLDDKIVSFCECDFGQTKSN